MWSWLHLNEELHYQLMMFPSFNWIVRVRIKQLKGHCVFQPFAVSYARVQFRFQ